MDAHIDRPLTNERLARLLNMPEATFARMFKATTQLAPYQFVLNRRVERARHLLLTTTWPIAQVAYECGFSSQSHFTTTFKARVGITPNALRRTAEGRWSSQLRAIAAI
ncbi:MAG: helix-turn-helix transcriptional regulator [Pseudomonadota bacterium]